MGPGLNPDLFYRRFTMENEEAIRRIAAWVVASDNIPEEVIDALDLAVEALNSTRKETPKTNGDRIRG